MRKLGNELLMTFFKNKKNVDMFDNLIYKKYGNSVEYINCIYQLSGMVNDYSVKECYDLIKNDEIKWNLPIYKENKIEEEEEFNFVEHPFEAVDSIMECKCGSKKILSFAKQTRSADEGMTVFLKCLDCNRKWVESG